MAFWIAALLAALIVALWLVRPLLAPRGNAAPQASHDLQVFRDQLRTLNRDVERGVLTAAEAEGTRAEISRRLLSAAQRAEREVPAAPAPRGASRALAGGVALIMLVGAGGIYLHLGNPGLPDRPLATRLDEIRASQPERPSQAEAEELAATNPVATSDLPDEETERLRELIAELRRILADRPDDVRGRRLLADSLMRLQEHAAARAAAQEVVDIQGEAAPPADRVALAEAMILAAGGYVSPGAERELGLALQAEPGNPVARYYAGLALAQTGRYGLALRFWEALLEAGPPDAPWIGAIRAQIGGLRQAAQARGEVPGPTPEDLERAQDMAPGERAEMIEGMVASLASRLGTEGGTAAEWARLIRAYGALDRTEDAARIWREAEETFADAPRALETLRRAARDAGVEVLE